MKKYIQFLTCALLFSVVSAKAACDIVITKDGKIVRAPSWATKEAILPKNMVSQMLGFKRLSSGNTPDGTWEMCQSPNNKPLTKYGSKNGLFDGVFEAYDEKTGALVAKGQFKEGLRVGTWQIRDENGNLKNMAFENGLPAEMMQTEDGRRTLALLKMYAPQMDADANTQMKEMERESGGKVRQGRNTEDVNKNLDPLVEQWKKQIPGIENLPIKVRQPRNR